MGVNSIPDNTKPAAGFELSCIISYFTIYVLWLFIYPESEFFHWATLVLIPFLFIMAVRRFACIDQSFGSIISSIGIERGNLVKGIPMALTLGFAFCVLQFFLSQKSSEIVGLIRSGEALYLFPLAILLMAVTAGFTEEFFFRGIVQTRIETFAKSKLLSIVLTSFIFAIYHIPYAYLKWPSKGNWPDSLSMAFGQAIPIGLVLGTVFVLSRKNLFACVLLHSMINALPAMSLLKAKM